MSLSILRLPAVKSRTGLARSTIYALIQRGEFPRSYLLGRRSVGWLESDISDWISDRTIVARQQSERQT